MAWDPPLCLISPKAAYAELRRRHIAAATPAPAAAAPAALRTDSRRVERGDIFLAYRGVQSDGHAHLAAAAGRGAALLVVEDAEAAAATGVPYIHVTSGRAAWTYLAAAAFDQPQEKLTLLGVTGTNGKTSTVWMTAGLLSGAGIPCLTVGTLGAYIDGTLLPTRHTTPDPDVLYALFAEAVQRGIKHVAMEVSSHAVCQEKLLPLRYAGTAFTSFTRDHLDYHGTMAAYFEAKWRLFTELARPTARHAFWDGLAPAPALGELKGETVTYGLNARERAAQWGAADHLQLEVRQTDFHGSELAVASKTECAVGRVPYFARHAVENFLAAQHLASTGAGRFLGAEAWGKLKPVPGRLEQVIGAAGRPQVVVDYAHTPDALEKTLVVLRPFCKGRLTVVFGCGGDRDRGKRPEMGKIAERLADRVVVTSDNPRTEDPRAILGDVTAGMSQARNGTVQLQVEVDREAAIAAAIGAAQSDDLVLIAGKGHEAYQIIGTKTLAFDDREVARRYLTAAT